MLNWSATVEWIFAHLKIVVPVTVGGIAALILLALGAGWVAWAICAAFLAILCWALFGGPPDLTGE